MANEKPVKKKALDILSDLIDEVLSPTKQAPSEPEMELLPYSTIVYETETVGKETLVLAEHNGWLVAKKHGKRWAVVFRGESLDACRDWVKGIG